MTQLSALLNFPNTLTGNADFNIQLALTNSELTKGEIQFRRSKWGTFRIEFIRYGGTVFTN